MKKVCFSGLIAGTLLYVLAMFSACMTCLNMDDGLFSALLTALFLLGLSIVLLLLIRQRSSLKEQFLSGLLCQAAFWLLLLFDGSVGITRRLVAFAEDNYAAGLILVLFWMSWTGLYAIGFLGNGVLKQIRKYRKSK